MLLEQRFEFIDELAALPVTPIRSFSSANARPAHNINSPTASVLPETVNTFLPGVSEEIISDVNLCKLVMHNAATKKFPNQNQLAEWYQFYLKGLSNIGWANDGGIYKNITVNKIGITLDQIALDLAMGLIGGSAANALRSVGSKSVEAVKGSTEATTLLNNVKVLGRQGNYDFAPVWVDNAGQPHMIMSFASLDASERTKNILFWKTTRQTTVIKSASSHLYLDNSIFGSLRNSLRAKYLASAEKFIIDLPDLD